MNKKPSLKTVPHLKKLRGSIASLLMHYSTDKESTFRDDLVKMLEAASVIIETAEALPQTAVEVINNRI